MNETDLIVRARQQNEDAWVSLIQQHQEPVFRLAYLLLGNGHDAEDVAQEVFIRAYQALDRFDTNRPLRPWLMQITRNLAANRRRSWGRYWRAIQRFWATQAERTEGPEAYTEQQRAGEELWEAVRQLHQVDQEVIYLRFFLGLSVTEAADSLEIAEGTVKSRLSRALARLRTVINVHYPDLGKEARDEATIL